MERRVEVGILVRDAKAQLAFYRDTLGLEQREPMPLRDGVQERLAWGGGLIKLTQFDSPPEATNPPGGMIGATGLRYITFIVDDLDGLVARCAEGGYPMPVPPLEFAPGRRMAIVEDPEGNWVELAEG